MRLRGGPKLSFGQSLGLVAAGFGVFVVGGGFAVDRRALRGLGHSRDQARVRVLGLGALEYAVLAPVAWICALLLLDSPDVETGCAYLGDRGARWRAIAIWLTFRRHRTRVGTGCANTARHGVAAMQMVGEIATHREHNPAWMGIGVYWTGELLSTWAGLRLFGITFRGPARACLRDWVRDDPARLAARGRWGDGGADAARVHVGGRATRGRRACGVRVPHRHARHRARPGAHRNPNVERMTAQQRENRNLRASALRLKGAAAH